MKRNSIVLKMSICAVMSALSIVLNRILVLDFGFAKITLYALPIMLISITYGKGMGILTGLVVGVVLQLTSEYGIGITSPVWALAPIAWGGISELSNKIMKNTPTLLRIAVVVFSSTVIAFLCNTLGTFADYWAYGYLNLNLVARLLALPFTTFVYITLLFQVDIRKEAFVQIE